ncbi:MAG: hypothetical protein E6559_24020 [Pantoea sp.]|nr:hypothetical protein [Pantoea sp.]
MISPVDLGVYSKGNYGDDKTEVEYRCCARTAYYSLFHHFKLIADSIPGGYDKSLGSHERVIRKLLDSTDAQHRKYGVALSNYKDIRVKADYRIDVNFSKSEAYKILRFAEKTLNI